MTAAAGVQDIKDDGHTVTLIDVRDDGMDPGLLAGLLAKHGDDVLLNQRSTTWRECLKMKRARRFLHFCPTPIFDETPRSCDR